MDNHINQWRKIMRWQTCLQVAFNVFSSSAGYTTSSQSVLQVSTQVVWKCWCCKVSNLWLIITSLGYLVLMNRRTEVTRWQTSSQVFFAVSVVCVVSHPSTQDSRTVKVQAWKYWCCKVSDWWEWTMVILCDKVWQGVTQCVTRWHTSLQISLLASAGHLPWQSLKVVVVASGFQSRQAWKYCSCRDIINRRLSLSFLVDEQEV